MRYLLPAIAMAGLSLIGTFGALAAPVSGQAISKAAAQSNVVTQVAERCGEGYHRGPDGRCHRN